MNVNLMFSILGLIGVFLCCCGDLFLDLKGSDNQKLPLMIFGITLRKIHPKWFCDLPGIIRPSFGLAMQGLIGIVALCL